MAWFLLLPQFRKFGGETDNKGGFKKALAKSLAIFYAEKVQIVIPGLVSVKG
jgi:hypothetical protein